MTRFPALALCLLLTTPVMAQTLGEKTGVNSAIGIAPKTQDFVTEAAQSDMFEIASSKLALAQSDEPTKVFAQQMIDDHTKTTGELKKTIADGSIRVTLPTDMSGSQQSMLTKLKGLHGAAFTSQYHSDQVSGHKSAVSLFQRYGKGGENSALRNWAATTAPALEHHLQMAQSLNK